VKLLRFLALVAAALTVAVAVTALRRSGQSGQPFGTELRAVAAEWACPELYERARRAAVDGLRAAELRAEAADRELAAAAPER
jgi:hypothetical protein